MKRIAVALVLMVAGIGTLSFLYQPQIRHHIVLSSAGSTPLTLAELTETADIVAVVRPTGNDSIHWNSANNERWTPSDQRLAMIYNDQRVTVVDMIRGPAVDSLTIRNIGGVVGDTKYELEGLEALEPSSLYLVFLKSVDTPTREGWETALSFISQEQGVFVATEGGYVSDFGLIATPEGLRAQQ